MFFILLAISLSRWATARVSDLHPLSDEYIDYINSVQDSWVAGRNFPSDTSIEYLLAISNGTWVSDDYKLLPKKIYDPELIANLPKNFDARQKWNYCPSLNEIRRQGACGACWAFGSVEAMTDRICIHSEGKVQKHLSAEEVTCCAKHGDGCQGGETMKAYDFWVKNGIVTGGNYGSHQGCQPYTLPEDPAKLHEAPPCMHKCISGYNVSFAEDKSFGKEYYHVSGVKNIMAEISTYGPVTAAMQMYSDIWNYQGGVYKKNPESTKLVLHAVKILGWGEEGGGKYWLVANSWGENWGIKGFFKILRGTNECGIEESIVAGSPKL